MPSAVDGLFPTGKCEVEHRRNEGTYGVFVDYCSMLQKGPKGEDRLDREATLFQRSLDGKASTMASKASAGLASRGAVCLRSSGPKPVVRAMLGRGYYQLNTQAWSTAWP